MPEPPKTLSRPTRRPLTREDVLLLIASGAGGQFPLDPIRLMKGAFLVSQRGRAQWKGLFEFKPYAYGPFDKGVYATRDALVTSGLLAASSDGRYEVYSLTESGRARVDEIVKQLGADDAAWFAQIGEYVTSVSFQTLLNQVYTAYPEFASNSVARL
jgi:hypothetical protein